MRIISFLVILLITTSASSNDVDQINGNQYKIIQGNSWIRVLAYPDGPLKRFGHHHVISHNAIVGTASVNSNLIDSSFEALAGRRSSRLSGSRHCDITILVCY